MRIGRAVRKRVAIVTECRSKSASINLIVIRGRGNKADIEAGAVIFNEADEVKWMIIRGARPTTHKNVERACCGEFGEIILVHPPISCQYCINRVFVHGAEQHFGDDGSTAS